VNISPESFLGRTVLVTGHTGFKGSWLALWLNELGAKVSGYALDPDTTPNHFEAAQINQLLLNDFRADVRDKEKIRQAVKEVKPDFIFHLAAQPLVLDSYKKPYETFEINVLGTANLLDVINELEHPAVVVVVTSDKCYLNDGSGRAFIESDSLGGHDPYSASKAATEILVESYRSSFFSSEENGVSLATVRAGNVIGGGDWCQNRIVPDCMRAFSNNEPVKLRSPGSTRPWQHVLEPLSGYLLLASRMSTSSKIYSTAWNFGPNESNEKSVEDLTKALSENWPGSSWGLSEESGKNNEAKILSISSAKAASELGWRPTWGFDETVAETVDWYRTYYESQTKVMREFSLETIKRYSES
jgi:CDP-glucose 4,6-dehydratase